jgi:hypothetical protein
MAVLMPRILPAGVGVLLKARTSEAALGVDTTKLATATQLPAESVTRKPDAPATDVTVVENVPSSPVVAWATTVPDGTAVIVTSGLGTGNVPDAVTVWPCVGLGSLSVMLHVDGAYEV